MQNLLEDLKELLQQNQRFMLDGNLFKNKIVECALNVDSDLIALLLKNENIKRHFFTQVGEALVFDKIKFQRFVSNKEFLPDSFTTFKSDIGLMVNDAFLKANSEVTLSFPYKDCVLEGGQSREEDRRNEIFFNVTLAPNEIDMLLKPKVFTNAKRYTTEGLQPFTKFCRNEQGAITDNLIIKGNNLLALHSIKREFAGRVKLIYIDPPYNTGNDGFKYNDSFKHSTWLVFMKNRLEIAKELLANDGSIYINIDQNESHYLKILMDEIFGRENLVNEIVWLYTGGTDRIKGFNSKHDNILFYSKTKDFLFNNVYEPFADATIKRFNRKDEKGRYKENTLADGRTTKTYMKEEGKKIPDYWSFPIVNRTYQESCNFDGQKPELLLERIIKSATNKGDIVLDFHLGSGTTAAVAHKMGRQYIGIEQMDYIETVAIERLKKVIGKLVPAKAVEKPEAEQMELLMIAEPQTEYMRLEYDNGGISKSVNWRGGGEFVYLELKKYNQEFIDRIMAAETSANLLDIWQNMKAHSFIAYNADIEKYESKIAEFKSFTLAQQKEFMLAILDANQLYVNLSSLEDKDFACTEEEIQITNDFYSL